MSPDLLRATRHDIVRPDAVCLLALLAIAGLLRVPNLGYDLPEVYEEATYVHLAAHTLDYAWNRALGRVGSVEEFRDRYHEDPTEIVLVSRAVMVLFALATVVAMYYLGKRLGGWPLGLIAACAVAVFPDHVRLSRTIGVDVPTVFWGTCALIAVVDYAALPSVRRSLWAGALIGLSASSKYTGATFLVPFWTAHVVSHWWRGPRDLLRSPGLWLGSASALGVFILASPYCLLDFSDFWRDFSFERLHVSSGHFGLDPTGAVAAYAATLGGNMGVWLGLPSLLGIGICCARKDLRARWLPLLTFSLLYTGTVATWSMYGTRYLLPIFPCLALFAALGIVFVGSRLETGILRNARPSLWLGGLLLLLIAWRSVPVPLGSAEDTRTVAKRWMQAQLPDSSLVAMEFYTPDLDASRYRVVRIPMMTLKPELSAPYYHLSLYRDFDYLVVSSGISARYALEPDRYPKQCRFYRELDADWSKVTSFRGDRGPSMQVYRNPDVSRSAHPSALPDSLYRAIAHGDLLSAHAFLTDLGRIYLDRGWIAEADQVHRWRFIVSCRRLMAQQKWEQASEALEGTLGFAWDFQEVWLLLAVCRQHTGDLAGAREAASRALRLEPGSGEALGVLMDLADAFASRDDLSTARTVYREILRARPGLSVAVGRLQALPKVMGNEEDTNPKAP